MSGDGLGKQIESLERAVFHAIYVTLPLSAYLGMSLESIFSRYLYDSPLVCMSGDGLGRQSLSLFMRLSPCLHVWRWAWKGYFVAICVTLPLFACLGMGLESRFCRYLRDSPLVCMSGGGLGRQSLSLFT